MTTLKEYKKYWDGLAYREKIKREKLRKEALKASERLKKILTEEFQVKKVVLFGSILEEGCFDEFSDIDIAVEGLPKDEYFSALAKLMAETSFDIDLKPIEDLSYLLKQRIEKGRILYEKRENS